ncbi:ATP-dependent RNA helicase DDX55 [Strongyloides ratti]|uniref:ATP-dependent RNA helicase n=1 Tax=Strongyloides ratti TaxID=34506 RepID=A0A090LFL5_STRRB|nr:ATP-dependent RNA helicase DDX55 [Strongyloides ratti]CEF68557.1 ATP-dependent RNA helicase DDX55 [Strongyloides ratti]
MTSSNEVIDTLDPSLVEVFKTKLGHKELTPVQKATIKHMLSNYDVICQAPTGSGKTLAFALPIFHLLRKQIKTNQIGEGVGAIVLLPTRELAIQVSNVLKPFCEALNIPMSLLMRDKKLNENNFTKTSILIATAGKLKHFLQQQKEPKQLFKHVEILIIDEADRFADLEFKDSISALLAALPKQRRTSLFSATQAKDMEEFLKYGLRNPLRITIKGKVDNIKLPNKENDEEDAPKSSEKIVGAPKELSNYYLTVPAEKKIITLVKFLQKLKKSKVLIFMSSSQCVDFYYSVLRAEIPVQRAIFKCKGLSKTSKDGTIAKFERSGPSILLTTDVLARGIDIKGIDWVIQFNIPKKSSWFIHRAGRTARNGRKGNAIVFLTPEEINYVNYIQLHEKLKLDEYKMDDISDEEVEEFRNKLIEKHSHDRDALELVTRAYMSLVKALVSHDCQIVCKGKHMDLVGYANSYGLLRLPKLPELAKRDLSGFRRPNVKCSDVPYKDEKKELERQKALEKRAEETEKKYAERNAKDAQNGGTMKRKKINKKEEAEKELRKKRKIANQEWNELAQSQNILKKLKKGKISKEQADELL